MCRTVFLLLSSPTSLRYILWDIFRGFLASTACLRSTHRFHASACVLWSSSWRILRAALHFCLVLPSFHFHFLDCKTFASRVYWYLTESILPLLCAMFPASVAATQLQTRISSPMRELLRTEWVRCPNLCTCKYLKKGCLLCICPLLAQQNL